MVDNCFDNGENNIRLKNTYVKDKSVLFKSTYQNNLALLINKWKPESLILFLLGTVQDY